MSLVQRKHVVSVILLLRYLGRSRPLVLVIILVKIKRNWSVNMTILLGNLLAKTDLVSKNVSKRGKMVDFG